MRLLLNLGAVLAFYASPVMAQTVSMTPPTAVIADPAPDVAAPARMAVLAIPTGGVKIVGVAYLASGPGPHPTVILCHGLPGNEKNLDLAQAIRRTGWNVVTFNYRGSWGSPGTFGFANSLEDVRAVLAYVRDPAHAQALGVDPGRLVLAGHSMGGWATLHTAAADPGLEGVVAISAADLGRMGVLGRYSPPAIAKAMDESRETLAGVTGESLGAELIAHADDWTFAKAAPGLKDRRLLVLYSDDGFKSDAEKLVAGLAAAGGVKVQAQHVATDHGWSDHRIALAALVVNWLQSLKP